jgi:YfiH family protein
MDGREGLRCARSTALLEVKGLLHGFGQRDTRNGRETAAQTRLRVASGLAPYGRLLLLQQVHGTGLVRGPWEGRPEGDVGVLTARGSLLGIETADCLPILLVDPRRGAVAAAHAGWRGTAAGAAAAALGALVAGGSEPCDVIAALGPCIGACCYQVGEEVRQAFGPARAAFFQERGDGRPHLDLREANRAELLGAGLRADKLHQIADCTFCRPDLYHSFRRDGAGGGRLISWVGFRA